MNRNKKQGIKSTRKGFNTNDVADHKKFTPEQMAVFQRELKRQKRRENLPVFIITAVIFGAIFYTLITSLL